MYNNFNSEQISGKELSYLTDTFKNEELMAKLCVQAAVHCQSPSLKHTMTQLAQERLQHMSILTNALQQQSGLTH
ncbi:hypothetical protein ABE504_30965 [Paenibacillus oryzisoli]|uniref:hypothetical protein n=1 Tax=Paenibacillus oryzisoli TaxID=1850517 RepID=UPI003D2B7E51